MVSIAVVQRVAIRAAARVAARRAARAARNKAEAMRAAAAAARRAARRAAAVALARATRMYFATVTTISIAACAGSVRANASPTDATVNDEAKVAQTLPCLHITHQRRRHIDR